MCLGFIWDSGNLQAFYKLIPVPRFFLFLSFPFPHFLSFLLFFFFFFFLESGWALHLRLTLKSSVFLSLAEHSFILCYRNHMPSCPCRLNQTHLTPLLLINRKVGLQVKDSQFTLEGFPFRIISGTIDYFRIPRNSWRLSLRKMQAGGFNTLTTWVVASSGSCLKVFQLNS